MFGISWAELVDGPIPTVTRTWNVIVSLVLFLDLLRRMTRDWPVMPNALRSLTAMLALLLFNVVLGSGEALQSDAPAGIRTYSLAITMTFGALVVAVVLRYFVDTRWYRPRDELFPHVGAPTRIPPSWLNRIWVRLGGTSRR